MIYNFLVFKFSYYPSQEWGPNDPQRASSKAVFTGKPRECSVIFSMCFLLPRFHGLCI